MHQEIVHLENLEKHYDTGEIIIPVLHDLNLSIKEGEYVAIMGASGSGKSTLMNILGFLDRPTGGHYHFLNKDADEYTDDELAELRNQYLGFVFQSYNLLPRTTSMDNVKLPLIYVDKDGKKDHDKLAQEALESVGLGDKLYSTPGQLSGGQQQRVAIARALINDPKLILADEPTGNLDSKSSGEIMEIFSKLNHAGKTIIMITHEKEVAEMAKRIIHLRDGKIVGEE